MTDVYKPIPQFENYGVSAQGIVKNLHRDTFLAARVYKNIRYYMVTLIDGQGLINKRYVHRLTAQVWLPNPDPAKYNCVGFKDKDPKNYALDNLYWTNQTELMSLRNSQDRYYKGETHHSSRFTWDEIQSIRSRWAAGEVSKAQIAREYGVYPSTIGNIIRNISWKP